MAAVDAATTARRRAYLDGLADDGLAEQAATEVRRKDAEESAKESRERREELVIKRDDFRAVRLRAVVEAEITATALVELFSRIFAAADGERKTAGALGTGSLLLAPPAVARRFSRYLSETLRALPVATPVRFGEMVLARFFPQGVQSWAEAERRALGEPEDTPQPRAGTETPKPEPVELEE